MAALLPVLPYVGEILTGAALLTYTVVNAFKKDKSDGLKEQVTALEKQVMEMTNLTMQSNKYRDEAEARLRVVQNALLEEQTRKEEQLRIEKEELKKTQAERERLMDKRYEQFERKQREMIDAEKELQRMLAEDAKKGLKRSHDEFERQMALDRERLAKEEEFLFNARLEHERCLEEERQRFKQSQANYERSMEEDRQRIAQEMNTFAEAQKKWDNDRVVLKQNYDKLQTKLNEGYLQLRRDQQALEKRLQSKMEDVMDEQKNLSVLEKEQKLKDLTETYLSYCEMYGNDPENMTTETKEFQRKFKLQLTKVKNSMQTGDNFLSKLEIWAKGAMLDMKMLTFLSHNKQVKHEALQASGLQYQRDMGTLMSNFNASNALPSNVDEVRAIENSFCDQVESCITRALPSTPSPLAAIEAPVTARGNILTPTWTEYATTGGGVSAVPARRQVQLMAGNPTNDSALVEALQQSVLDDKPQPAGDASWARCDAISQSLRESRSHDRPQLPVSTNSTRSDDLTQLLRQSAFGEQPQNS